MGEDVPFYGEDGGEEGEQEERGQEGEGDCQEGRQEAGDHCNQFHLENREILGYYIVVVILQAEHYSGVVAYE